MTTPRAVPASILIAVLGLAAAGCGSTSPGHSSSSAAQNQASGPYAYARCMRSHGVGKFPDPKVTTTGSSVSVSQMVPSDVASSPAFKRAQQACARLQSGPQGGTSGHQGPSKAVLLAFARCLRAHGIKNFPDPNSSGQLPASTISAAGVNIHTPAVFKAGRSCVHVTHGQITVAEVAQLVNGSH